MHRPQDKIKITTLTPALTVFHSGRRLTKQCHKIHIYRYILLNMHHYSTVNYHSTLNTSNSNPHTRGHFCKSPPNSSMFIHENTLLMYPTLYTYSYKSKTKKQKLTELASCLMIEEYFIRITADIVDCMHAFFDFRLWSGNFILFYRLINPRRRRHRKWRSGCRGGRGRGRGRERRRQGSR